MSTSCFVAGSSEQLVLGIESSCDDTGVAVLSSSGQVLGEALFSQTGQQSFHVTAHRLG